MKKLLTDFDVIVVGGGHAGIEAAHIAAQMGSRTLLITLDPNKIGTMPCNPAIGGIGKGHIVFEVSALGGLMPKLCTQTYLQARMLNTKKGPAVQGLRLQIDKESYSKLSKTYLESINNLTILGDTVEDIIVNNNIIEGVKTAQNQIFRAPCVIFTTGTFLNGRVHIGLENFAAGRRGENAVTGLSKSLTKLGLQMGRLKTGTPPRLSRESIDFSKLTLQQPDNLKFLFEFTPHEAKHTRDCYITYTNEKTHEIIRQSLHLSAMYSGNISGKGPRYCPSIEDKIARFPDKTGHHIFVEPESASTEVVYPSGISTSLPLETQKQFINSIKGFENAEIIYPGYAIEYDFVYPHQLNHTLEVRHVNGLFLAGQINGTTGYEEAAGQGIIAGINAHLKAHKQPSFILSRHEGYIGVMIDDLVSLGIDEPYRMFTSRAESRLTLRQDNVFYRLADKSYNLGLIDKSFYETIQKEQHIIQDAIRDLKNGKNNEKLLALLGKDEQNIAQLHQMTNNTLNERSIQSLWAEIRYEPYLKREQREIEKAKKYQTLIIPAAFDYTDLPGLSKELQEKLKKHKPTSIAQAALIQGITPAAISVLIFKIQEFEKKHKIH